MSHHIHPVCLIVCQIFSLRSCVLTKGSLGVLMNENICSWILSSFLFDLGFEVRTQFFCVYLFEYDPLQLHRVVLQNIFLVPISLFKISLMVLTLIFHGTDHLRFLGGLHIDIWPCIFKLESLV